MAWHIKDRIRAIFDKEFAFRKNLKCSDCAHTAPGNTICCYVGCVSEDGETVYGNFPPGAFGLTEKLRSRWSTVCGFYAEDFISREDFYNKRPEARSVKQPERSICIKHYVPIGRSF